MAEPETVDADDIVRIIVEDETFNLSRKRLAARSQYFSGMFSNAFREKYLNEITLNEIDKSSFRMIVNSSCLDSLPLCELLSVYELANMLIFHKEVVECESCLEKFLYTPIRIMTSSCRLGRFNMHNKALASCLWFFTSITSTEEFLDLDYCYVLSYLDNDQLNVPSELKILDTINCWIEHSAPSRQKYALELLLTIRLNKLRLPDVQSMSNHKLVLNDSTLKKIVSELLYLMQQGVFPSDCLYSDKIEEAFKKKRSVPVSPCFIRIKEAREESLQYSYEPVVRKYSEGNFKEISLRSCNQPNYSEQIIGSSIIAIGFKLFIFDGVGAAKFNQFFFNVWCYDFLTSKWSRESTPPYPRRNCHICSIKDDIFLIGGIGLYRIKLDKVSAFNIIKKDWRECAPIKDGVQILCVCPFGNKIILASNVGYIYDPYKGTIRALNLIMPLRGVCFVCVFNHTLFAVDVEDTAIWCWDLIISEREYKVGGKVGKFSGPGSSLFVGNRIFHFMEHSIETFSLTDFNIESKSVAEGALNTVQHGVVGYFCLPGYF